MPSLLSGQHFARASGSLMIFYFRFFKYKLRNQTRNTTKQKYGANRFILFQYNYNGTCCAP